MKGNFLKSKVKKIIRDEGAQRVSADAIEMLNRILTDHGTVIAKKSILLAKHNSRKTVRESMSNLLKNISKLQFIVSIIFTLLFSPRYRSFLINICTNFIICFSVYPLGSGFPSTTVERVSIAV